MRIRNIYHDTIKKVEQNVIFEECDAVGGRGDSGNGSKILFFPLSVTYSFKNLLASYLLFILVSK